MKIQFSAIALCFVFGSCAASDDGKSTAPPTPTTDPVVEVTPEPVPPAVAPTKSAVATISSVLIAQDCPDPKPQPTGNLNTTAPGLAPAAKGRSQQQGAPSRSRRAKGFAMPCTQSTVQLAFRGQGATPAKVEVKAVRLLSEDGAVLTTLNARLPSTWADNAYKAWDEMLPANGDLDAGYKLSIPDWNAISTKTGQPTHGKMYTVEVDIEVAGQPSTLQSAKFERARPMNIRT